MIIFAYSWPLRAEETLPQLITAALERSTSSQQNSAQFELAQDEQSLTLSPLLPSLKIEGQWQRQINDENPNLFNVDTWNQNPFPNPEEQRSATLIVNIPLWNLSAWQSHSAAIHRTAAAQLNLDAGQLDVQWEVFQQWVQYIEAKSSLEAARISLLQVERDSLDIAVRQGVGSARQAESLQAKAELAGVKRSEARAQADLSLTEARLFRLTGNKVTSLAVPDRNFLDESDKLNLDEAIAESLRTNPKLKRQKLLKDEAQSLLSADRALYSPTLSGFALASSTAPQSVGQTNRTAIGVQAAWNLDWRTIRAASSSQSRLQLSNLEEMAKQEFTTEQVTETWNNLRYARAALDEAEAREMAEAARLKDLRQKLQEGTSRTSEILKAEADRFAEQLKKVQALTDLLRQRARLRILMGQSLITPSTTQ